MFKNFPPITKNLLIINLIAFLAQMVAEQRGIDLVEILGLHFFLAEDFQLYQLFSYLFLHADFTHLFFNMFSLWMFGRIIEQTMGERKFIIYYLVCGIGAGICQEVWQLGEYYFNEMYSYSWVNMGSYNISMNEYLNLWTTIGASGACYGVLLAFGMTFPNQRIMLLIPPIPMKAKYFVVGYALIEVFSAFSSNGNIAHFAHLGGMLFGWLLIRHWRRQQHQRPRFNGWENWQPRRERSLWEKIKERIKSFFSQKPRMKVHKGGQFKDRAADYDYNLRNKEKVEKTVQDEKIEQILKKIKESGYESLTADEKRELFQNSRK